MPLIAEGNALLYTLARASLTMHINLPSYISPWALGPSYSCLPRAKEYGARVFCYGLQIVQTTKNQILKCESR